MIEKMLKFYITKMIRVKREFTEMPQIKKENECYINEKTDLSKLSSCFGL